LVVVLDNADELNEALDLLQAADVGREHVSIVSRSVEQEAPLSADDVQTGDEAENKTARGAAAGSVLGALAGASLLFIPGVGPLIASGAFAGALTGGIVGGFLGSMQGWGVHEDHVRNYDNAVRHGKVLAVIHGSPLHLARAQRALQDRFHNVHLHAAESGDAPELFAETAMKHL
jgi:phage tail tape-measure protein